MRFSHGYPYYKRHYKEELQMAKNSQYQPIHESGFSLSDAQEVAYAKEFKKADIAGGIRKPKVKRAKSENPDLLK